MVSQHSMKVMVVSEFPVDSVIGNSKASSEARQGILKYVALEKPNLIFVDGLVSSYKDPEVLISSIRENETLEEKMDFVIKLLAMNIVKDLKTEKEKVQFLQNNIGLDSVRIADIMNKTTKELSTYLYTKKSPKNLKKSKSKE